ncbi:MAG: hypothetical protein Q4C95_10890 [Planctomycetia bacterium]|nr:hypothetical protein [Planctomycetia bacterium]
MSGVLIEEPGVREEQRLTKETRAAINNQLSKRFFWKKATGSDANRFFREKSNNAQMPVIDVSLEFFRNAAIYVAALQKLCGGEAEKFKRRHYNIS